jgi:hypothetical protein
MYSRSLERVEKRHAPTGAVSTYRHRRSVPAPQSLEGFECFAFRRSWPFQRDPPTGRILVRTYEAYSAHRPFSRSPQGLRFHRHSNQGSLALPHFCFPTAAQEVRFGFTRLPSHAIKQPPPNQHGLVNCSTPSITTFPIARC